MLSLNERLMFVQGRISNLESCINTLLDDISILEQIEPIDQETIDGYASNIELKKQKIQFMKDIIKNQLTS
jgi:hypothetical protein